MNLVLCYGPLIHEMGRQGKVNLTSRQHFLPASLASLVLAGTAGIEYLCSPETLEGASSRRGERNDVGKKGRQLVCCVSGAGCRDIATDSNRLFQTHEKVVCVRLILASSSSPSLPLLLALHARSTLPL